MTDLSFSDLLGGKKDTTNGTTSLEIWYRSIQDTPIKDFNIADLGRSVRQEMFLEHVLPVALKQLQNDPISGEQWDGDLAYDIARISKRFWQSNPDLAVQTKKVMESQDYSFSDLTQKEVNSFLRWMSQQQ